ncbi:MAG: hypothetical protein ACE5PT_08055 [Gemmatimonadales bacterium]
MPKQKRTTTLLAGVALGLMLGLPTRASAHDEGVLKLASRNLPAGSSVRFAGEKFSRNTSLALVLVGTLGRIAVGKVRTDSAGGFTQELMVPADLRPGTYRLVAIAPDGDEAATLDVTILAAEELVVGEEASNDAPPTAEPLELERASSTVVTGLALLGIAFALVIGGALLRRPAS